MSSSLPRAPQERRIIPLRTAIPRMPSPGGEGVQSTTVPAEPARQTEDAARHYLKFMLPGIPVAAFILTFVLCDVLLGLQSATFATSAHIHAPPENPALLLAAALIVSATTGSLCMWIYFGYLRIAQRPGGV